MGVLEEMALESYDRIIGLELSEVAVDCCITKAPCGGHKAGKSPVDRGKRGISSARRPLTPRASLSESSPLRQTVTTRRF